MPKIRLKLFGTVTLTWALFTTWVGNKAQISVTGPNSVSQLC